MTAENIFDTAVTLMFGDSEDKLEYMPLWLNTLNYILAENFRKNNTLRAMRGKQPLTQMPLIAGLADQVPYEDEFTRQIIPIGCAGYIFLEDERGIGTAYKDKYEFERARVIGAQYENA